MECLQIVGDSKLILDWFNDKCTLQVLALELSQMKIRELQEAFQDLKLSHVYKEFNQQADTLSKEALSLELSLFSVTYFEEKSFIF